MADVTKKAQGTGLKWRARAGGKWVPYWFPEAQAIEAGYPATAANLSEYANDTGRLLARVMTLQSDMVRWLEGKRKRGLARDGLFRSVLLNYETHPQSPLHANKHGTIKIYTGYLKKMIEHIGGLAVDDVDGTDVMDWFAQWRTDETDPDWDKLSVAHMKLAVLKSAVSFGVVCRMNGCIEFEAILRKLQFEAMRGRTVAPTADQIIAARAAAHEAGAPLRALAYAMQFETTLRQWDVVGQWVPLSDRKPSAIIQRGKKWIGLQWSAIDRNQILAKVRPTKTEDTTEVEVSFDLAVCPMVQEELARIPEDSRNGPMIINRNTGLPYTAAVFWRAWRADFKAAGLPADLWNRDMRSGGITEGAESGASRDDRRTLAGHAQEETTIGYERGTVSLEAHRRVMASRKSFREKKT